MNLRHSNSFTSTIVTTTLVCALGVLALFVGSDGFRTITVEGSRKLSISEQARQLPDADIFITGGGSSNTLFPNVFLDDKRIAIVSFIYTSCNTVCAVVGSQFQQLQREIVARGLGNKIQLVSVSFDPSDTFERLSQYAEKQRADEAIWRFVGIRYPAQRQKILDIFGVLVIPAPFGQFEHNAAFHIVNKNAELINVIDYDQSELALNYAESIVNESLTNQ